LPAFERVPADLPACLAASPSDLAAGLQCCNRVSGYGRAVTLVRTERAATAAEETAPPAAVRAVPAVAEGLLVTLAHARGPALASLQRSVGNGAIARAAIARYEAGEHAQFGGPGKTLKVGTVEITEAELAAMGDFY
jgi:hypothetical protein